MSGLLWWLIVGFAAWVLGSVLAAVLVIKIHGWLVDAGERLIRPNGQHSTADMAELLAAELNDRLHAEFAAVYLLAPSGDLQLVGAAGPVSETL